MGKPLFHYLLLVCFFLAGQSCAMHGVWNGRAYQGDRHLDPGMATGEVARQSLKQKFLDALYLQLLRKETAATNAEQDLAEEEADRLTSITRYVGVGYNLLKGSPEGEFDRGGADPGILINCGVIFEFTYDEGKEAVFLDEKVQVPDQVGFHPRETCVTKSTENAFSGAKSYQDSLNFGISPSATISGFQFGLSAAMKSAKEKTAGRKRVSQDQKQICNYGRVTYLTAQGKHTLSKVFYDRVKSLPMEYNLEDYMQFIKDYGTHIIVEAVVGRKTIARSYYTYSEVYQQLKMEGSGGITVGGNYNGFGGSLGLDIGKMKGNEKNRMKSHSNSETVNIGTEKNPSPIYLDLWNISEALRPEYWTNLPEAGVTYESLGISQKKKNLEEALADYADFEGVDELKDPAIRINMSLPNGKYALPAPKGGCPKGWSRGNRTQGTAENTDVSSGIVSRLAVNYGSKTISIQYCVKTDESDDAVGFEWPKGSYCIARKGGCPEGFEEGSISWNDYKNLFTRKSRNKKWGTLPDGEYGKNTVIFFCCRNDNRASSPMMLPIAETFVLYRYGGKCQEVVGNTTVHEDFITYGDTSWVAVGSNNKCTGAHPDDDGCNGEHRIHFCYYRRE